MKKLLLHTIFFTSALLAQKSSYSAPEKLMADGVAIGTSTALADYSEGALSPTLVDYDNDGDLDLMLGTFAAPRLVYFENIGTPTQPEFTERKLVTLSSGAALSSNNF